MHLTAFQLKEKQGGKGGRLMKVGEVESPLEGEPTIACNRSPGVIASKNVASSLL